jgi:diadenylate cyclase
MADMNLAKTREGVNQLAIRSSDVQLPLGVMITEIRPSTVKVTVEKKIRKTLRIKVKTSGRQSFRKIAVDPSIVEAEGPEHVIEQIDSVETEEVSLSAFKPGTEVERRLLSPAPQVKILREEPVKVRLDEN